MTTNKQACPIAYSCLSSYTDKASPFSTFSHETEEWDDEVASARESDPTPESVRLRAFYAVEILYHRVIPTMFFSVADAQMHREFLELRAPRSSAGLDVVIALGERYRRRAMAKRAGAALASDGTTNQPQLSDIMKTHVAVVEMLIEASKKLRSCLRSSSTAELHAVGTCLGSALAAAGEINSTVLRYVREILNVNNRNAAAPWRQNFQD